MSAAARAILESRLAKLLGTGVDDNLDELLDTFIDMESVADVIEYLSNFVVDAGGDGYQDLNEFAVDVVKYGLGEYNVLSDDATSFDDDRKPAASSTTTMANTESKQSPNVKVRDEAAVQREVIKRREMEARERQRIKNREDDEQRRWNEVKATVTRNEKQSGNTRRQQQQQQQGGLNNHLQPIQSSSSSSFVAKSESNVAMQVAAVSTSKVISYSSPIPPVVIKHDPRAGTKGKPMKESCGCYGTKCNAITNCLNCGRISCDIEGINDYCHFCNIWIGELQFTDASSTNNNVTTINDPATRHKERLLEYDRTAAARTLIHDDQEDYYSAANSMWSSEQEREDNRLKEESRQHNLHERKKPVLNVKF